MGRTLKRVPLDFGWPLNTIWKGFENPYHPTKCKYCDGSGLNVETKKLSDDWYTHLRTDDQEGWCYHLEKEDIQTLINNNRLWDFTRIPINDEQRKIVEDKVQKGENNWLPFDNGYVPTPEEVNEWARKGMGHDSINQWICVKGKAKRLGIWGLCPMCDGKGNYFCEDKYEKLHEEWKPIEPPQGDGYQLWETTSEGSPLSPVFKTLEELCEWAENNATTFGSYKTSKKEWMEMLDEDFVCHKEGHMVFI